VSRVVFYARDSGYFVAAFVPEEGPEVKVTGYAPGGKPASGAHWEVRGRFFRHPKHGEQFVADSIVERVPEDTRGLREYLGSGAIPGVGRSTADALVKAFGNKALDVIEHEPERLTGVPGIGKKKSARIREGWERTRAVQEIMVFLRGIGIGPALSARVYRHFGGGRAGALIEQIQSNPYLLSQVRGIGFPTADGCAQRMGIDRDSDYRIESGVDHVVREALHQGHTLCPTDVLADRAVELLGVERPSVIRCIDILLARGSLVAGQVDDRAALALPKILGAEQRIADWVARRLISPPAGGASTFYAEAILAVARGNAGLSASQVAALERIARAPFCVLTGGPGTGKTTMLRAVVEAIGRCRVGGRLARVVACAPTGRAAQRIEEAVGCKASTIHRALGFDHATGGFMRSSRNPLDADFVVVDEASMIDTLLLDSLLDAVPDRAALLLVGDSDQLPSVGPGKVLRDLIDSGVVPVARLTEIFRQAEGSGIAAAARSVLHGKMPEFGPGIGFEEASGEDAYRGVVRRVESLIREGFAPDRIQVLSPMRRGPLGTDRLNEALRAALNPKGAQTEISCGSQVFREGDRVIQTRNNYELDVMNGDIGRIERVCRNSDNEIEIHVRFEGSGERVRMEREDLNDLEPAYAITIHKSQGGEYPAVVMAVSYGHYMMLNRNLIYTGITRARKNLSVIGETRALAQAVREGGKARARWTALESFLRSRGAAHAGRQAPAGRYLPSAAPLVGEQSAPAQPAGDLFPEGEATASDLEGASCGPG
jgi:exodeoxyribonuclease V alpha subunit